MMKWRSSFYVLLWTQLCRGMRPVRMQTKPSTLSFRAKMRAEIDEFLLDPSWHEFKIIHTSSYDITVTSFQSVHYESSSILACWRGYVGRLTWLFWRGVHCVQTVIVCTLLVETSCRECKHKLQSHWFQHAILGQCYAQELNLYRK